MKAQALAFALASVVIVDSAHACELKDIEVRNLGTHFLTGSVQYIIVTGLIVNHCANPSGPQITITLNDTTGKPMAGTSGWPDSTSNIPPGGSFWFEMHVSNTRDIPGKVGSITATVIGANQW